MSKFLRWDETCFRFINQGLASAWLDGPMLLLSSEVFWGVVFAVALATFLYFRKRDLVVMWLLMAVAAGGTDLFTYRILKPTVDRERPCYQLSDVRVVPPSCGGRWSFPSNHAANAMAITTVAILHTRRRLAWLCLPVALLVALSRVYLGVHYPGDVIAGILVGLTMGTVIFALKSLSCRLTKAS